MAELHTIDLGDFSEEYADGWVKIRAKRGFSTWQKVNGAGVGVRIGDENTALMDPLGLALVVFGTSIVAWSLTDAEGQSLHVSPSGFQHEDFDPDLGEWLFKTIEDFYQSQRKTPDELKDSAPDSTES